MREVSKKSNDNQMGLFLVVLDTIYARLLLSKYMFMCAILLCPTALRLLRFALRSQCIAPKRTSRSGKLPRPLLISLTKAKKAAFANN